MEYVSIVLALMVMAANYLVGKGLLNMYRNRKISYSKYQQLDFITDLVTFGVALAFVVIQIMVVV